MSRSSAARQGEVAAPVPWASAIRASSTCWPAATGWSRRWRRQGSQIGSLASSRCGTSPSSHRIVKATDSPARVARDPERARHGLPPGAQQRDVIGRLVAGGDRLDRGAILRPRALDRVVLDGGREERLAHERLLDQRQHVGHRRPARGPDGPVQLAPDLPPGRRAVGAVADRVARAQHRRDRLADRVVDHQALAPELDERQRRQARERHRRRVAGHERTQQRERHAAQHARRVERLASSAVEPVEVERRELLDDGRQDRVLGRVRPRADGRGGQLQRQRVPAREAVDPRRLFLVEPGAAQHLGRVCRRERAERHGAQQLAEGGAPDGAGGVAGREHDARVRRQRGQEVLAQPAVEQPQALGGVDDEHRRGARREPVADRAGEALRGRLDRAAVDGDDRRAALGRLGPEGAQQRGFARPGDAVHDGGQRPVVLEQAEQGGELGLAADDGRAALGEQRSERARHGQAASGSGSGACTIVATTRLIASVGSISASAWRSSASGPPAS